MVEPLSCKGGREYGIKLVIRFGNTCWYVATFCHPLALPGAISASLGGEGYLFDYWFERLKS